MNERIKELAEQAGLDMEELRSDGSLTLYAFEDFDIERFAELVRADEREWVNLTDMELDQVWDDSPEFYDYVTPEDYIMLARAVEAKLKEKNHGH